MKKGVKIVTIGGGSSYTPELVEGFIKRYHELPIRELWLVDIEAGREKLEIVGNMAKRMVKAANIDCEVHLTLDRREALKDADFVTTQFRVGLLEARIKDERIPLSHGIIGQETNGAGGMFKAFRTIPVILGIVEDMRELCPDAWLINFTNPAGMVTEAVLKYGKWDKVIGLCNVPIGAIKSASDVLGKPEEDLFFKFAGINHLHWHRIFDKDGTELTETVIDGLYGPNANPGKIVENIKNMRFLYEQVKHLKMLPCPYHRYYYMTDAMLEEELTSFKNEGTRGEVVKKLEDSLFELYKDPNLDHKPEELSKRGGAHYSDAACEIINSIYNNKGTLMVVSTRNNGAIDDVPYDSAVEITSVIRAHGAEPVNFGKFPPAQRGLLQVMKSMEELTIEAAVTGDYATALQAFTSNPLVPSGDLAKTILDEMLEAHKEFLPQFAK
ncbi:6-phospho-beta-glucosidase [Listeria ivanovii]|uniref:6-phospho-beta-glucosidase n=1 Tax=Listeria ivanovii (strain ATCC BAA-678 / PAM 55) TaxID=881621 RepID=G2ZBS1_LISIP|nr:6-phospho-beta-glucosidase [Listeria ivanovii]AHI55047.1 diacetylchitobiose-6-phosphate hydrolase [Listeria ivanovii WSLC3009]AIS64505.1 diacetylchitobiose-6-phosphate hydrolase [Listeria ivanovii subsp. ivanovii]MBC1758824.1 6-phospho-beta-glucosidase [Listeria ivanovii]MCJ1716732.1 6-phospho-beta-glucosidase [Listeria ivanovii]MCJ1721361.1 6-phospho-beta-glucosidase [Listeria ivanovii]